MTAKDRLSKIRQIASNEKKVTVTNLSSIFQVTEETIRRDLDKLESEGFLIRTYGGAILNSTNQVEGIHFYKRSEENVEAKQKVAVKAVEILRNKTTMAVDSGTTVMECVKLLKDRSDLTILTNSTEIFRELALSDIKLVSTGGEFNPNSLSLQGRLAKEYIKQYHVDIMVMSCKGLDMESGVTDSNESEAEIKKAMLQQASEVALLVDASRFDKKGFVKLTEWENIDYIITDEQPSDIWSEFCKRKEIKLVY